MFYTIKGYPRLCFVCGGLAQKAEMAKAELSELRRKADSLAASCYQAGKDKGNE